jgi:hypothetical protein
MQEQFPGFDQLPREVPKAAERSVKPFDPTYAGETKARDAHNCDFCGREIVPGDIYYQEGKAKFLGTLRGRKLCTGCYEDRGAAD